MNPILVDLGIITIRWYSIFILFGVLFGGLVIIKEYQRFSLNEEFILNLFFYTIIFGILGARLYYVLFNLDYYSEHLVEIFKIWEGGLAIHGGIIAGLITIIIYSKKYKVNCLQMLDIIAPGLILAQAIGRWGNFFNSEAYGASTTYETLKSLFIPEFIIKGMYINGTYYHPTFLYESILCLLGFIIMLIIRRKRYIKNGQIIGFYFMWYGLIRIGIEILRTDSLMIGNFKAAILVSIILIIIGFILNLRTFKKSKFDNRYNDSNNQKDISF